MKHMGRGIATIAIMAGVVGLGYVTNNSCTAVFCGIVCMFLVWVDA